MPALLEAPTPTRNLPKPSPRKKRRRMNSDDAMVLWHEYRRSGDPRLRDRLVLTYAPLVKFIVYRKISELPVHHEADDLISAGIEALIKSLDR